MSYVTELLQGQVEILNQLRNEMMHDDLACSKILRSVVLESAHVTEQLSLLKKRAICNKLNDRLPDGPDQTPTKGMYWNTYYLK